MKRSFSNLILLGFTAPLAVFALLTALFLKYQSDQAHTSHWVVHTHEVIAKIHDLGKLIVDMETGQRGFVITGKDRFLEPYRAADKLWDKNSRALMQLVSDNPPQVERVRRIRQLKETWEVKAAGPEIRARRNGDFLHARLLIEADTGKSIIDSIRQIMDEFVAIEKQLMILRVRDSDKAFRTMKNALIIGLFIIFVLVGGAAHLVHKSANEGFEPLLKVSEKARNGDQVDKIVASRSDEFGQLADNFNLILEVLEERKKQALHKNRLATIGELAAGVGHEINNPLAIAKGNVNRMLQAIQDLGVDDIVVNESYNKFNNAVDRISNIVNGLRTFARADFDLPKVFFLNKAVNQTIQLVGEIIRRDGITLQAKMPETNLSMMGNQGRMEQAILNLITNARDACETIDDATIEINLAATDSHATLSVRDNGMGIPKKIQQKIFDGFYTTKPVGKGTGMGLSTCAQIVHEHGGELNLTSEEGKGATFTLSVPIIATAMEPESKSPAVETQSCAAAKILVVDDEADVREILVYLLEKMDHSVDEASNGVEAVKILENKDFDIVITDLKMPKMDGRTLVRKINQMGLNDPPKILVATGGVMGSQNIQQELQGMISGILKKPYNEDEIAKLIAKAHNPSDFERKAA